MGHDKYLTSLNGIPPNTGWPGLKKFLLKTNYTAKYGNNKYPNIPFE